LGPWVKQQRRCRKEGTLDAGRTSRLEAVDFVFSASTFKTMPAAIECLTASGEAFRFEKGNTIGTDNRFEKGNEIGMDSRLEKGTNGNPANQHGGKYGKRDSPHTELSLRKLAMDLGIQPSTTTKACRRAKERASRSTDRVYFECMGHSLVWYKPE
jgi:hypothetical protein